MDNDFQTQLSQSQKDAELLRWGLTYAQYFSEYLGHFNTDKIPRGRALQALGVDHIVTCAHDVWWVDFMLRERPTPDIFIEYEVGGRPGKFRLTNQLSTHIAYSFRPHSTVQIFAYDEMCEFIKDPQIYKHFETKTATSIRDNRRYQSKGLIIPTQIMRENLLSYQMLFIDG